jgi:hypothetical protein
LRDNNRARRAFAIELSLELLSQFHLFAFIGCDVELKGISLAQEHIEWKLNWDSRCAHTLKIYTEVENSITETYLHLYCSKSIYFFLSTACSFSLDCCENAIESKLWIYFFYRERRSRAAARGDLWNFERRIMLFVHMKRYSGTCANTNDLIFKVIWSGTINFISQQKLIH